MPIPLSINMGLSQHSRFDRVVLGEKIPLERPSNVGGASGPKVTGDRSGLFPSIVCYSYSFYYFYTLLKSLKIFTLLQNKQSCVIVINLVVDFMHLTVLSPF